MFHSFTVLAAGGNDIDSGCVDAAVAENVRQLCNVLFNAVKGAGEQVRRLCGNTLFGFTFIQVECADFRFKTVSYTHLTLPTT